MSAIMSLVRGASPRLDIFHAVCASPNVAAKLAACIYVSLSGVCICAANECDAAKQRARQGLESFVRSAA